MFWLLLSLGIPVVVVLMLFFSAMDDFWQIITLRIDVMNPMPKGRGL
ncbi:hypothetical protein HMI48_10075 [Acidithiobacillus ferrooxidans]|nr:hypothetical protein [Acidithiobacillus ferrooxidans]MBU2774210.1 hypothetical protein [Acidithiobacillus ferrooxidans]